MTYIHTHTYIHTLQHFEYYYCYCENIGSGRVGSSSRDVRLFFFVLLSGFYRAALLCGCRKYRATRSHCELGESIVFCLVRNRGVPPTPDRATASHHCTAYAVGSTEVLYLTRSYRLDSPEPVWSRVVDVKRARRPCPQRRSFFFFPRRRNTKINNKQSKWGRKNFEISVSYFVFLDNRLQRSQCTPRHVRDPIFIRRAVCPIDRPTDRIFSKFGNLNRLTRIACDTHRGVVTTMYGAWSFE